MNKLICRMVVLKSLQEYSSNLPFDKGHQNPHGWYSCLFIFHHLSQSKFIFPLFDSPEGVWAAPTSHNTGAHKKENRTS